MSVVTESGNLGHLEDCRRGSKVLDNLAVEGDVTLGGVCCALNGKFGQVGSGFVEIDDLVDAHLVGGERTSLIGADDAAASQGFDRRQATHNSILSRHLTGTQSKTSGDDNRKTLGNGSHTQGDGNLEVVDSTLGPAAMTGVVEVGNVDQPDEDADNGNDLGQVVTKVVEFLLQGGRLRDLSGDALVDISNSGVGASQDDNGLCTSSNNSGSREEHVNLILLDSLIIVDDRGGVFSNALALSGQDSLINRKAVALDGNNTAVGGNSISNRNGNNVARNKVVGLDSGYVTTVADDVGFVGGVFLQSGDGLLGTAFLGYTDDGVEDEDCENLHVQRNIVSDHSRTG